MKILTTAAVDFWSGPPEGMSLAITYNDPEYIFGMIITIVFLMFLFIQIFVMLCNFRGLKNI